MNTVTAIERLKKVLKLEQQQNYRNKAVIGGLARLAERWQVDALKEATSDAQRILVRHMVGRLNRYGQSPAAAARKEEIETLMTLAEQWESPPSLPDEPAFEPPVASPPKPAPAPKAPPAHAARPAAAPAPARPAPNAAKPVPAPAATAKSSPAPARSTAPPARPKTPAPLPLPASIYGNTRPTPVGSASLGASVSRLPGVGPSMSERLAKMDIHTIGDLLYLLPRRYDDYSAMKPIFQLRNGDQVSILANVWSIKTKRLPGREAAIVTAVLSDSTATIQATWFNSYVAKQLREGQSYVFSGKVQSYLGQLRLQNPSFEPPDQELLHTGRLVPVYPLTKGIADKWMRSLQKTVMVEWGHRLHDYMPESVRQRAGLPTLSEALQQVHFPDSQLSLQHGRQRLAFDELFMIQLGVLRQRRDYQSLAAPSFALDEAQQARFLAALPFTYTAAQARAARTILDDLAQSQPMSRLMQGDVGSGKTAVAANAMWAAVLNGAQAAMMAPTEILAEQHFRSLSRLYAGLDVEGRPLRVALLTGRIKGSERAQTLQALAAGEIDIAVGTHALIQEGVEFRNLGLAVIDEQHRFGVRQRSLLRQKALAPEEDDETPAPVSEPEPERTGPAPHLLVMTATPIPRTLALTIFGDLDASVIDEMPPGRRPIKTRWLLDRERERAYNFIRRQVAEGRQAFIIYPLVEESEKLSAKAAIPEYEQLCKEIFPQLRLGLLHGRMKSAEKDAVMQAMQAHEIDILVATSVVEVGIDIPNATVIVIEDADRFGLAQLHQFRGRVGRGEHESCCILISEAATPHATERLNALEQSQDGFALAEKDLQLRGPGDFFGARQSGLPDLKMAPLGDLRTLERAREEAIHLLHLDPGLSWPEHAALARKTRQFWSDPGEMN